MATRFCKLWEALIIYYKIQLFIVTDVILKYILHTYMYLRGCDIIDLDITANCGVIHNWVSAKWPLSGATRLTHVHQTTNSVS